MPSIQIETVRPDPAGEAVRNVLLLLEKIRIGRDEESPTGPTRDPSVPPVNFTELRVRYLIVLALHLASKAILAEQGPGQSEAQDMRELLDARYHHLWWAFLNEEDMRLAFSLGFAPTSSTTAMQVIRFLEANSPGYRDPACV
ncbi:hypothetical protein [Methylobacterium durans]|uniref:hypothetical protein n=1 Tax=Methylobacterium durans TaxID=2202825 RepID=UPI0013A557A9|nr:hypothetical protein [Methylobacterium durans]